MTAGVREGVQSAARHEEEIDAGGGLPRDDGCSAVHAAALVRLEVGRDRAVRGPHGLHRGDSARVSALAELLHAADRGESGRVHAGQLYLGLWLERAAAALLELPQVRLRGVAVPLPRGARARME